jgi:outer membrane protein assembly factor BamB
MPGAIQASVLFDQVGRACVADMSGCLRAFSEKGTIDWTLQIDAAVSATGAMDSAGGRFFVGTHSGSVWAVQSANGNVLWRKTLPTKSDPRILSNLLYLPRHDLVVLSSWGGSFVALQAASGEAHTSWDAGFYPQCGATAGDSETLYFLRSLKDQGCQWVGRSTDDKEQILFHEPEPPEGARRVATTAETVLDTKRQRAYFLTNGNRRSVLHCWDLGQTRELWTKTLDRFVLATPTLAPDGSVHVTDLTGTLHSFSESGDLRFQYNAACEYLLAGAVCDAEGSTYFGDPLGRVHFVDPQGKGKVVFEARRSIQARPSFDLRGNLCVPCTDRHVYVFRNRAKLI